MAINNAVVTGVAALCGSVIGAVAPIVSSYMVQRGQMQRDLVGREIAQREALYGDFLQATAAAFADGLMHSLEEVDRIIALYTMLGKIRLVASDPVVHSAELVLKAINAVYAGPNRTLDELRGRDISLSIGPMGDFSSACRNELLHIRSVAGIKRFLVH